MSVERSRPGRYHLLIEWTECDECFGEEYDFPARDHDDARRIADRRIKSLLIDVEALLTDENGEEVSL